MRREPWKLKDVVMMAILGVLFAVVYMAVFYGGTAISVALTPLGLSAFGFELIYGVWFMAATIAAYIIRKPGAALITEVPLGPEDGRLLLGIGGEGVSGFEFGVGHGVSSLSVRTVQSTPAPAESQAAVTAWSGACYTG